MNILRIQQFTTYICALSACSGTVQGILEAETWQKLASTVTICCPGGRKGHRSDRWRVKNVSWWQFKCERIWFFFFLINGKHKQNTCDTNELDCDCTRELITMKTRTWIIERSLYVWTVQSTNWLVEDIIWRTSSEGFPLDKLQDFMNHGNDRRG